MTIDDYGSKFYKWAYNLNVKRIKNNKQLLKELIDQAGLEDAFVKVDDFFITKERTLTVMPNLPDLSTQNVDKAKLDEFIRLQSLHIDGMITQRTINTLLIAIKRNEDFNIQLNVLVSLLPEPLNHFILGDEAEDVFPYSRTSSYPKYKEILDSGLEDYLNSLIGEALLLSL